MLFFRLMAACVTRVVPMGVSLRLHDRFVHELAHVIHDRHAGEMVVADHGQRLTGGKFGSLQPGHGLHLSAQPSGSVGGIERA